MVGAVLLIKVVGVEVVGVVVFAEFVDGVVCMVGGLKGLAFLNKFVVFVFVGVGNGVRVLLVVDWVVVAEAAEAEAGAVAPAPNLCS